jgi:hypothetical protein
MATFKKKELNELVGGDMNSSGGDRNPTGDSEIETGPVQKPFNDNSEYEKGTATTTDRVFNRYRQDIPWFAVYSFGGTRTGRGIGVNENNTVVNKQSVEDLIEDLVKKSKDTDLTEKGYDSKVSKLIDSIKDCDLTDKQLADLTKTLTDKKSNISKTHNI